MRRWIALVLFALGLVGCARGPNVRGPTAVATDDAAEPRMMLRFAIYFLPEARTDPAKLARELRAQKYPFLALIEGPGDQRRPAVAILPTAISEFPPPAQSQLDAFSRGLDAAQIEQVSKSKQVLVFLFLSRARDRARVHSAALDLVGSVAERAGGVVWDEDTREAFSVARWKQRAELGREPSPDIRAFITIHGYREDDGFARLVTLGMAKLGLPDVSIRGVPISSTRLAGNLVNLVCQTLFERNLPKPGPELDLDLAKIRSLRFRKSLLAESTRDGTGRAEVALASVRPDPGDADNALLQVAFPKAGPKQQQEAVEKLLAQLFGFEDSIVPVEHDEEMLAASRRARDRLLALKPRFARGIEHNELLQVKFPFPVPGGGNEWMWVEVVEWNGKVIKGVLQNTPFKVPDLAAGAHVERTEDEAFDYIFRRADGTEEGNETGEIMQRRQGPD